MEWNTQLSWVEKQLTDHSDVLKVAVYVEELSRIAKRDVFAVLVELVGVPGDRGADFAARLDLLDFAAARLPAIRVLEARVEVVYLARDVVVLVVAYVE